MTRLSRYGGGLNIFDIPRRVAYLCVQVLVHGSWAMRTGRELVVGYGPHELRPHCVRLSFLHRAFFCLCALFFVLG